MWGPFDQQSQMDLLESGTYAPPGAGGVAWSNVGVQEQAVETVFSGTLSIVRRNARITKSISDTPTRPIESGTYTAADGLVWQIVGVVKRALANFWELGCCCFSIPGGLLDTGTLSRRDNSATTAAALSDPIWTPYASAVACRFIPDAESIDTGGETAVDTLIGGKLVVAGYREIRAGDQFADSGSVAWNVDGTDAYDIALGAQVLHVSRRV